MGFLPDAGASACRPRSTVMPDHPPLTLADLARLMAEAAARDDFEEAAGLRNRLFVARQAGLGEDDPAPEGAFGEVARQQPGAMGIGSQHPRPSRPDGWTPPTKPAPMTKNSARQRR